MAYALDRYRNELALRTLVLLNTKVGNHVSIQKQRDDDIIEAISISQKHDFLEATDNRRLHEQTQRQLERIVGAILTHRDGKTTTISPPGLQNYPVDNTSAKERPTRQFMTFKNQLSTDEVGGDGNISLGDFSLVQRKVLNCLSFRNIRDRMNEVAQAYYDTFEWIFKDPNPSQRPWTNFLEWLQVGERCYWINGKAGSGKSTLLKYIYESPKVKDALSAWAGQNRLLVASYFSWNLGSTLQKSHLGLLRSLLFDILEQVPDLIPIVLPELCRAASIYSTVEPTFIELKKGFERLAQQNSFPLRICLFIDGIDEFEGDHEEISNFFISIPSALFKIVLSSRPIPVCVDIFTSCASLRLQDLTYGDIRSYTDTTVRSHRRWCELLEEEGQQAEKLIDDIVLRAEGVFLWVVIAVSSLIEGLRNYDRVDDLKRRLLVLPPDLENLYQHMLDKLQPLYRCQGANLFLIIYRHIEVEAEQPLTALQLSFVDSENTEACFGSKIEPLSVEQKMNKCKTMEGRLRSRCCGLVEVWQDWRLHEEERLLKSRVIFLHRTVVEFLSSEAVRNDLLREASDGFDPNVALASCFLMDVKTQPYQVSIDTLQSLSWQSMRRCMNFCRITESGAAQLASRIVDELDNAMVLRWNSADKWHEGSSEQHGMASTIKPTQKFDWTLSELRQPSRLGNYANFSDKQASMFTLAATMGLQYYIHFKCDLTESAISSQQKLQAMIVAIYSAAALLQEHSRPYSRMFDVLSEDRRAPIENYKNIVERLLKSGVDPNESLERMSSPWYVALQETKNMVVNPHTIIWCEMLGVLLRSGAYINEVVQQDRRLVVIQSTVLFIISRHLSILSIKNYKGDPAVKTKVAARLESLRTYLLDRGATNREWSEVPKDSKKRDATPAPWLKEDGSSFRSKSEEPEPGDVDSSLKKAAKASRSDGSGGEIKRRPPVSWPRQLPGQLSSSSRALTIPGDSLESVKYAKLLQEETNSSKSIEATQSRGRIIPPATEHVRLKTTNDDVGSSVKQERCVIPLRKWKRLFLGL